MKLLLLVGLAFLISGRAITQGGSKSKKNKIDQITTAREVEKLILKIDKRYPVRVEERLYYKNEYIQSICDSLKIQAYTKADFNKDGYTDLLVVGQSFDPAIVCILSSGQNKFSINRLTRRTFEDEVFARPTNDGNETYVDYYYFGEREYGNFEAKRSFNSKRLVYKFGDFVEYNASIKEYKIEKIEYKTTMCFGTCPEFELVINSDRTATYKGLRFNEPDGKFTGKIDSRSYSDLISLLNYIDFPNLRDNYSVSWTCDQTSTLTITYDDGKTKTIEDYGLLGSFGLGRLYKLLFNLRRNQDWESDMIL